MKKLFALLLAVLMIVSAVPALAQGKVSITQTKDVFDPQTGATALMVKNETTADISVTVEVYDEASKIVNQTIPFYVPAGTSFEMPSALYKALPEKGNINTYYYKIATSNNVKTKLYFAQKLVGYDQYNNPIYEQHVNTFYNNNTVSSFGPHFRDLTPELTNLWYMFTPLDLTRQGRQTYELVASNIYVIGEVHVDVAGDTVVITYHNYYDGKGGNTEQKHEYLNIFGSYGDVVIPNDVPLKSYVDPVTKFRFGVPFSIQYDLGGDTNVLMSIRNVVSYYRFPRPVNTEFRRFWENSAANSNLRSSMLSLMDPIVMPSSPPVIIPSK
ncbi:MAG TPA: hypothetical protein GXZ86_06880 [Clostridiales bacterium]|nr:hypothetical protein [Clostridiales bacterium]